MKSGGRHQGLATNTLDHLCPLQDTLLGKQIEDRSHLVGVKPDKVRKVRRTEWRRREDLGQSLID